MNSVLGKVKKYLSKILDDINASMVQYTVHDSYKFDFFLDIKHNYYNSY